MTRSRRLPGPLRRLAGDLSDRLVAEPQPRWREPMLATLTHAHFSHPDWLFEIKLDGVRSVAVCDHETVRLVSRNRKQQNSAFPEVAEAVAATPPQRLVVDGEVVAFEHGRPSFGRLQHRMHLRDPERARRSGIAVSYYLFDLLHLDGFDTTALPLATRKQLLEESVEFAGPLRFSTHRTEQGLIYFEEACKQGFEGLIAKQADSPYRPGTRSRTWLKFKCWSRQEFVIGGFTPPTGSRTGFGAVLVGYHHGSRLRYAGKVGTGYDEDTLRRLRGKLDRLRQESPPFDEEVGEPDVRWVTPRLVCEVAFAEWTADGRLRHPRFVGLRPDRNPAAVVREPRR